jgi:DNA-binding NarL/FixJ family response regulator
VSVTRRTVPVETGTAGHKRGTTAAPLLRVVVGEDQPIAQEGLVTVLQKAGFEVVGVAADAEDLVRKANAHKPDVIVTDIRMPPGLDDDGLQAAKAIRTEHPEIGVLVLSQYLEDHYPLQLMSQGTQGVGYLLKERVGDLTAFTDAVRRVANGGSALDPEVVQCMVDRPRAESAIDSLTPREREVMALMAEGRSNQGIADRLVVTVAAVERHVTSIFAKLGLRQTTEDHRRVQAVLLYLRK